MVLASVTTSPVYLDAAGAQSARGGGVGQT